MTSTGWKRRGRAGFVVALLVAAACTGSPSRPAASGPSSPSAPSVVPASSSPSPRPTPSVDPLCKPPPAETAGSQKAGKLPPAIAKIARQVEKVRELSFKRPVVPEPVSRRQIAGLVRDSYHRQYPRTQAGAEGRALITMGVLPAGTDLYKAVVDYGSSQILGFYNTQTHKLVFEDDRSFSPLARFTLSHELTHALQDQNFGLGRLDQLDRTCRDDRAGAFLALIEGDAVVSQVRWARANLSSDDITRIRAEARQIPPPPASVPKFVRSEFAFPYDAGQTFVDALLSRGGLPALDAALRRPPVSTEQVLHPDRYPRDTPRDVTAPNISAKLGKGWRAIDFSDVGEGFLRDMFQLQLPVAQAFQAAAGWDGGQYRAFGKGSRTAVLLATVWDTRRDAVEFSEAMREWLLTRKGKVIQGGTAVTVLFGSDRATLRLLARAAAG